MMFQSPIKNHFKRYSLEISIDHKKEPFTRFWKGITLHFPYYVAEWNIEGDKYACSVPPITTTYAGIDKPCEDMDRMFKCLEQRVKESERDYALRSKGKELKLIPLEDIGKLLDFAMKTAIEHGANSVSMPAEIVSVAHFLSYPEEYSYNSSMNTFVNRNMYE